MKFVATIMFAFLLGSPESRACSPLPVPLGMTIKQFTQERILKNVNFVAFVEISSIERGTADNSSNNGDDIYTFEVLEQFAGTSTKRINKKAGAAGTCTFQKSIGWTGIVHWKNDGAVKEIFPWPFKIKDILSELRKLTRLKK